MNMKLSDNTLNLLKNFSSINPSLLFKQGNSLRTMSVAKNILAEVEIVEEFPNDFAIYDLNQFLNTLNLHKDPELDFTNGSYVTIREGKTRSKYFFADPNVIVAPPDRELKLPSEDVCFEMNSDHLSKIMKASAILQLSDLSVVGEAGVVKMVARDKKNDTSHDFSIIVGETEDDFCFNFKVENIKILPGSYEVVISKDLLTRFVCKDYNLTYFISLELDSPGFATQNAKELVTA